MVWLRRPALTGANPQADLTATGTPSPKDLILTWPSTSVLALCPSLTR